MSSRRLALLGAPAGPWVYTAGIRKPRVKVRGLEGSTLRVILRSGANAEQELTLDTDGMHDVPAAPWMKMSCHPPVTSVCAEILSGAADAVQST